MSKFLNPESKGRIYLVDDDPSFSQSLSHALRIEGYHVQTFPDVMKFLESDLLPNAIVISDMRMPQMTGLDLQDALHDRGINLPIIFVSGESTVSQAISAMKGGAKDFLVKPFQPDDLLQKIAATFAAREQAQLSSDASDKLSPRELEAFRYFIQGFGNSYVAEKMKVEVSTVKEFKTKIFKKLGVANLSELIEKYRD